MATWPVAARLAVVLVACHAAVLVVAGTRPVGSLLSELLQLATVGLAALNCLRAGRRLPGRTGRFWLLMGVGFSSWFVGQVLVLRYVTLELPIPAISLGDIPFLAFYLPAFAALFPSTDDPPGVNWARTLDLAQVGIVLGGVYLYFFFALNLGVERRVITLHFGVLDSYSLLNLLLVGSYLYAWSFSRGEARALYGRMALIFALYSIGDTFNTFRVIAGEAFSGDWLDISYSLPFALATISAARWSAPAVETDAHPEAHAPEWRLFPLLPPGLVLVVAGSVARRDLTLATILIVGCFVCFGARLAVTQARHRAALNGLRRSEAEYRSLVENAPYGIFRYAARDDRFLSVNQALLDMLGHADREACLALRPRSDVFAEPSGVDRLLAEARGADSGADSNAGLEAQWKRADGKRLTVRLRTRGPRGDAAAGDVIEASAEDITENRKLEDQLRQALKMEAVGRLAGGVAHDFNNLLMVMTGAAELMRRRLEATSPHLPQVRLIQKAAQDAADLTRQLLAFSRRQSLEPKVLDLNQVLRDMSEMLPRLIEESIEQRFRLNPALGRVKADLGQMRQVVLNLAVNARDAMPQGGVLTLATDNVEVDEAFARLHPGLRAGSWVGLSVADTGRGMDAETRARVFEPFFTTKEKGKGTGLGLATVYGIVKQSGGHIRAESEPGRGSTFIVLLPRFFGPADAPTRAVTVKADVAGSETILLVEDSVELRGTIREFLAAEGYTVVEAASAEAALELAGREGSGIDLVVADVVLPGLGGDGLVDRLGTVLPGLPVILMSGYSERTLSGPKHADVLLLQKPFPLDVLAARIREKLSGASGAPEKQPTGSDSSSS